MESPYRLPDTRTLYTSLALGLLAAATALLPAWPTKAALFGALVIGPCCFWILLRSERWLSVFLCALVILPPLPIQLGDSGPHPALFVFSLGLLSASIHVRRWNEFAGSLGLLLCGFTGFLFFSVLSAAMSSGAEIALGSLSR